MYYKSNEMVHHPHWIAHASMVTTAKIKMKEIKKTKQSEEKDFIFRESE